MLQGLKARTGRENQVYDKGYTRKVAGCVPINKKTGKILLITRRKQEGWVLPKGGWENDESEEEAALRETYEEAGAIGRIVFSIGIWKHPVTNKGLPKAEFRFFEMEVEKLEERWPEMNERDRQWFSYDDALKALTKPFMREVVEQCSLANNDNIITSFDNININHRTEKSGLFVASEDRKDFWTWIFSILVIILLIIWYLSTNYYNDIDFFSEKFAS
ncbi:unnamed protein product [Rhizophagus irregularis]|nr:unnamed protein product [Rhizophagus irregularis]